MYCERIVSIQIMSMNMAGASGGGGRRGRRRAAVMAEINVTPMVDVMLVLLIIFMVAAPLMTSTIDIDLPVASGGKSLASNAPPLTCRSSAPAGPAIPMSNSISGIP